MHSPELKQDKTKATLSQLLGKGSLDASNMTLPFARGSPSPKVFPNLEPTEHQSIPKWASDRKSSESSVKLFEGLEEEGVFISC